MTDKTQPRDERNDHLANVKLIDHDRVRSVLEGDFELIVEAGLEALEIHRLRAIVAPRKVYLQEHENAHTADRIIALPAYITHGEPLPGLKWIGSKPTNHQRGLPRAHAVVVLNDHETHAPFAILDGTMLSAYRTLAITLISLRRLSANPPRDIAILGMGQLGRLHTYALPRTFPSIESIRCYSRAPFDPTLSEKAYAVESPADAVKGADVVITVTAANDPYLYPEHFEPDVLIVNLSLMDLDMSVFAPPTTVIVDDLEQCLAAKKVFKTAVEQRVVSPDGVRELSTVIEEPGANALSGRVLVNPLGMSVQDLVLARKVIAEIDLDACPDFQVGPTAGP